MNGYVKLYRKTCEHPLFKRDMAYLGAWSWLLMNVAWKPHRAKHRKTVVYELARGQMPGSRKFIAQQMGWTEQRVRTFLNALVAEGMIRLSHVSNQQLTIITICNYSKFQDIEEGVNQEITRKKPEDNQEATTHEEGEEGKEREEKKEDIGTNVPLPLGLTDQPAPKQSKTNLPVKAAFDAYQAMAERTGLPRARTMTPTVAAAIRARMKAYGVDAWAEVLIKIESSAFLRGQTEKPFRCHLGWIVKPDNFEKIITGAYGNGAELATGPEMSDADADELLKKYKETA